MRIATQKKLKSISNIAIICCIALCVHCPVNAQAYFRGEQTTIQPMQVILENYTAITLSKEVADDINKNRFDKYNIYTYIQSIYDSEGKNYHILFQTSFLGKILFLSYSNNLSPLFSGRDKPLNVFMNCISHVNDHLSSFQVSDAAVNCIIERLNYFSN